LRCRYLSLLVSVYLSNRFTQYLQGSLVQ